MPSRVCDWGRSAYGLRNWCSWLQPIPRLLHVRALEILVFSWISCLNFGTQKLDEFPGYKSMLFDTIYVSLGIAIVHFIHQTSDSKPLTLLNQGVPREATGIWPKYALETVKRWHWHLGPGLEHPSAGFLWCRGMGSLRIAMKRRSMGSIRLKEWIKLWFWCFFLDLLPKSSNISLRYKYIYTYIYINNIIYTYI
jgi:hypothetical protein